MSVRELSLRLLTDTDLPAYKALRDVGLMHDPQSYTTNFNAGSAFPAATYATRPGEAPGDHFILGAFDGDGNMLGAVVCERESALKKRHEAALVGMIIDPEKRSQGVGRGLLKEFFSQASQLPGLEQVVLTVTASNARAVKMYEKAGFERYGVHPRAIRVDGTDHDTVLMIRRL